MSGIAGSKDSSQRVYQEHSYPLVRSGGLFLVLIGTGIIVDVFLSGAFIIGTACAIVSLMFAKYLSFGRPTRVQIVALLLAIILELALFIILFNVLPAAASSVWLIWILMIVGIHFLPMAITFGPRFAIAGALCMINALAGFIFGDAPIELFLLTDGALKVGFGVWLFKDP